MEQFIAWDLYAAYLAEVCGVEVDWDEGFYICPECGEPIYESDWEFLAIGGVRPEEHTGIICPVCGFKEEGFFDD